MFCHTWLSLSHVSGWDNNNCCVNFCQTWANSQNVNYFYSKLSKVIILSENNCHFVNLLSFESSSFLLSMKKITWLNSIQPKTRGHVDDLNDITLYFNISFPEWTVFKINISINVWKTCHQFQSSWNMKWKWKLDWSSIESIDIEKTKYCCYFISCIHITYYNINLT